jgi:hypothetical protein
LGLLSVDGTICCPVRGEANVERCVGCPYLDGAVQRGQVLTIHCRPPQGRVTIGDLLSAART